MSFESMSMNHAIDSGSSSRLAATADWLALACLAALTSIPFLQARHFQPIPSFWSEWWAFAFGLVAAGLLLIRPGVWRPLRIPAVALIPFALLAVALLQYVDGRWYFVESWLLYAGYLLWAMLLTLAARSFVARRGLAPLADVVAVALLLGALANCIVAALQFHNIHPKSGTFAGWVFVKVGTIPYSNLGQPNHFNHQLWLAIGSLIYLQMRERCRLAVALPALLLMLVAATLSGSKSILLYAAALTVIAALMRWRFRDQPQTRTLWRLSLLLLPLVVLLQWGVAAIGIAGDAALPTATQRLFNQVAGYQIRWRLLQVAWEAFLQAPLLGNGIGTMPWEFFTANTRFPADQPAYVAEHAHNLPLQLLAEFGIVPPAIMAIVLVRWALHMARRPWQAEGCWALSLLCIAAIHSLVEYPLWYAFFLGPVALLLGATDAPALAIHNGRRGAILCALIVAAGVVPLVALRLDYNKLESRFNNLRTSPTSSKQVGGEEALRELQRNSLLSPYVMLSLAGAVKIDTTDLTAKVDVCQRAIRFAPSRKIVFKCAMFTALKGDEAAAQLLMEQSLRAYPDEARKMLPILVQQARDYPQLLPLLDLTRRRLQSQAAADGTWPTAGRQLPSPPGTRHRPLTAAAR